MHRGQGGRFEANISEKVLGKKGEEKEREAKHEGGPWSPNKNRISSNNNLQQP